MKDFLQLINKNFDKKIEALPKVKIPDYLHFLKYTNNRCFSKIHEIQANEFDSIKF